MESVCDGKVHMSSSIQRECQPLMEACTSSLYLNNAFRVIGLPVHASTRNIKRRLDELKMAAEHDELQDEFSHALALNPLPTIDQIQNAGRRLQDIQTRFVDEFFWFWPLNWDAADSDAALLALANGDRSKAENIWSTQLSGHLEHERLAATHNLAVLFHLLATDMEHVNLKNSPPLLPAQVEEMDSHWRTSFVWWEKAVDHEPFWSLVAERVRAINDPGLSTGFVTRFRKCFPVAFDNINAGLAMALTKQGQHSRAALHIKFMQETHQGLDDTDATLQQITRPLHIRIDHAIQQATGNLKDDPKDGANRAEQLLKVTEEPLKALSTLLGAKDAETLDAGDEIAEAFFSCVIAYGNATEDWGICASLLEKGHSLASSSALQKRFIENKVIVQKNHEAKQLQEICWFCKKNKKDSSATLTVEMHGNITRERQFLGPTQIRWNHLKIDVPRCSSCKSIHERISWEWMIAVASAFIGGVSSSLISAGADFFALGAVIGFVIGLVGTIIVAITFKKPKTASLDTRNLFPQIKDLQAEGWRFGSRPSEANG